jgi:hypothetical protein
LTPQIFPAIFWHPFAHTSAASIITSNQEKWSLSFFLSLFLSLSYSLSLSFSLSLSLSSSNLVFLFNYLNFIWSFFNFKIFIETIKLYFKQNLYSKDELVTMFFRTPFFYFSNHFKSFKWSNQKSKKNLFYFI